MRRLLPIAALMLAVSACGNLFTPGAAVVDGVTISEAQLKAQVDARSGQAPPGTSAIDIQRQVLASLIQQRVVLSEADRRGIKVPASQVEQTFQGIRSQFPNEAAFQQQLKQYGFTVETLRQGIVDQSKIQQLQGQLAGQISEADLLTVYKNEQSQFRQVELKHIFFVVDQKHTDASALARARSVLAQLKAGGSFTLLARKYSADPGTAKQGGVFPGWQLLTRLPDPAIADAAWAAHVGKVIGPVRSRYGYHIMVTLAKRVQPFSEVEAQLRSDLAQQTGQQALSDFLGKALKTASVQVNPKYGDWDPKTGTVVAHTAFVPPASDQNQIAPNLGNLFPAPAGS